MLTERQIPLEISSLKGSHCRVMLGLFRYADKQGVCWPGLRTLAEAVPMSIRAVRRALAEMADLGYLAIEKGKGLVNRYRIAARFLRAMGHTVHMPRIVPEATLPNEVDERQLAFDFGRTVSLSQGGDCVPFVPTVAPLRTEGIAKESQVSFKKEEAIPFGRDAPLEEPPAGNVVKLVDNPALKAKKKEMRRQKVMRFVAAVYSGEESERRWNGMMGLDDVRDEQWWFDKCDAEMKLAKWDDVRDKHQETWQRLA
jgi:Helix-turn-helix domain